MKNKRTDWMNEKDPKELHLDLSYLHMALDMIQQELADVVYEPNQEIRVIYGQQALENLDILISLVEYQHEGLPYYDFEQ